MRPFWSGIDGQSQAGLAAQAPAVTRDEQVRRFFIDQPGGREVEMQAGGFVNPAALVGTNWMSAVRCSTPDAQRMGTSRP